MDGKYKDVGLQIHSHLNWKNHTEQMIPKLSGACYAIRLMVRISNINTFRSIYCVYFHSIIKCESNIWGNSSNSRKIFTLQKKIIKIMAGAQPRTSCRCLLKQSEILPVSCQYILTLMNFIISNQEKYQTNSSTYNINTRNKQHLHRINDKSLVFKKSTLYAGIKIFSSYHIVWQSSRMTMQNLKQP
jgi:IS1 family transposase